MDWSLLDGVPEPDRARVLRLMARRRYAAGEMVFHEGDPADAVHFVAEGHVMVRRVTPAGEGAALTVLGPGQAFGELAMLSPGGVHLLDALYAPVDQRVAHRLADLCRIYGGGTGGAVRIPLTQSDLAEMAGASRPATNRVLQRLAEQGLVVLTRGAVTVPDGRRLAADVQVTSRSPAGCGPTVRP